MGEARSEMRGARDWGSAVTSASIVLLGAYLCWYATGWGSEWTRTVVTDVVYVPLALAFTALAVRAAAHRRLDRAARRAWWVISAAFGCQLVAHTLWMLDEVVLRRTTFPSWADFWFLAFVPVMFAGLLLLPGANRRHRDHVRLAVDVLTVGASAFMVFWYLVLGPIFAERRTDLITKLLTVALPVGDLVLVLAVSTVVLRRSTRAVQGPASVLAAAIVAFVIADVSYVYIQLHGGFTGGDWPDMFWLTGCLLLVLAADRQYRWAEHREIRVERRVAGATWLPYGAIVIAYGLLGVVAGVQGAYPVGGMVVGSIALTGLVLLRQVYALKENEELAVTDPLTGLANRALVNERLAVVTSQPIRAHRRTAVLLIDLDRFKPINDAYGHEAGDAILVAVGTALLSSVRRRDTVGRLGGDEFAVILEDLPDQAAAEATAQRILDALRLPVVFGEHLLSVEASVGLAFRNTATVDGDALLHQADVAMYTAKRAGRGRFAVYAPELDGSARDAGLRRAIETGRMVLHYQPEFALADNRITAIEALVRWDHPTHGLLMPEDFIDLADETGAIAQLGDWVLRTACREALDFPCRVAVNVSARQLAQPNLVTSVARILGETGLPGGRLTLELAEGALLPIDEHLKARLDGLCALGVTLSVDDFGLGHAALNVLRDLPVSTVKLHGSLTAGVHTDRAAHDLAAALVAAGHALGLSVVAEAAEHEAQVAALRAMGCDRAQGFGLCPPLSRTRLDERLADPARA
ncbi:putative bifunctional diguanylate cyclase/phosphodiesterase [Catenuloplanes atrovinosus]|uniref:Diguanylate cyclase (GGDEF)-like protein n=1 Tax=Catenuloplanes atrovinosus TaxID=137266 RepID=A0AAE3YMP1_9ACTN|nr:EAL domain-containing protein [Catenuloplanes atrovinosus]MDR7276589.1 diguanylate cyclase (GGDEF)-like protein [Catenuloplanes atrovinosus]